MSIPVVGYATVDTARSDGTRQDAQRQIDTIESECERLGLSLVELVCERAPHRGHALERPAFGYVLKLIGAGDAKGIAVEELWRLGRSLPELGRVLECIMRSNVRLIAASPTIDTRDEMDRLAVQTVIEVARSEHQRLVERTRAGMLAARRKGPTGVAAYPELKGRIARMRADGMTLQAIADQLNAEGVPTVRGGAKWRPSSVQTAVGYKRPLRNGWRGSLRVAPGRRTGSHA